MNDKIDICYSHHQQLSSLYVGLEILNRSGTFKLKPNLDFSNVKSFPFLSGNYRGRSFFIDCMDGYNWISGSREDNLAYFQSTINSNFIFKRNYSLDLQNSMKDSKVLPFGFNYAMGYQMPYRLSLSKRYLQHPYWSLKYSHLLRGYYDYKTFEHEPELPNSQGILYQVRLWDPASAKDAFSEAQRQQMNAFRVECVRALREQFPSRAVAGVQDSAYSRMICPDLVISSQETSRNSYFNLIRNSAIGVTSNGLHQSIGWKMGEYIAASRAIVCERPYFLFPPHFMEGQHYLGFSTPEELVIQVDGLLSQPHRIRTMMQENQNYYQEYQRPDRLVWHILKQMA